MRTLLVIAKAPVPGRVKTRLTPPLTPVQAAGLAAAALADTLAAVLAARAERRVLVLDGEPGAWLPPGVEVLPQRGDGLAERLAAAFADVGSGGFLVGMDTPQVTPTLLDAGLDHPCCLGPARDGGYWGIGLPAPDAAAFAGVPMSADDTGDRQTRRLRELGYAPVTLHPLRDVDEIDDARAVAREAPASRFAEALRAVDQPKRI